MTPVAEIDVPAWRNPRTILRGLLVLHWGLVVLSIIGEFTLDALLPDELREYEASDEAREPGPWEMAQFPAILATLGLSLGATVGLWRSQRWACWVFLGCEIIFLYAYLVTGPSVQAAPAALLDAATNFVAGMVVALSFCLTPSRPPTLP